MIPFHYLAAIFKTICLHGKPVILFKLGVTLISPTKKEGVKMFLFHFESQNIVFRMHITQFGMKFPFQKYITLCSLIDLDFILIDQKCDFNTHPFVLPKKNLEISVALGLRKVAIVEKLIWYILAIFPEIYGYLAVCI